MNSLIKDQDQVYEFIDQGHYDQDNEFVDQGQRSRYWFVDQGQRSR